MLGLIDEARLNIADELSILLANTYSLHLKTQNYHWNVKGPMFITLHHLFESQYTEMAVSIDTIAERISTLGYVSPGSFSAFAELSNIEDETEVPSAESMVEQLIKDHLVLILSAKSVYALTSEIDDEVTTDLVTQRIAAHEKAIWMLESFRASLEFKTS